jgi:hypothetical protein
MRIQSEEPTADPRDEKARQVFEGIVQMCSSSPQIAIAAIDYAAVLNRVSALLRQEARRYAKEHDTEL